MLRQSDGNLTKTHFPYCLLSRNIYGTCPLCLTDVDATDKQSVQEEVSDPTSYTTQTAPESEHHQQPAERVEGNEADDLKGTKREQLHEGDQSQEEHDNSKREVDAVQPQHQHDAVPDQEEAQHEGGTSGVSPEPEDTEQVETFFSTMSHRYENATQEGHIL